MHQEPHRLYEEYRALVWSLILKAGLRRQEQEDVFMDSWQAIFSSLDSFDGRAKLSTWIARIAGYKIVDYVRAHRLIPLEESELNRVIEDRDREGGYSPVTSRSEGDPRNKAMRGEVVRIIGAALENLSPEKKFIVEKWMIGLKYREIAELLNAVSRTPVDTNYVGKQLFRAKIKLRETLAEAGIEDIQNLLE